MCVYDDQTVRCSVNKHFLPFSNVNSQSSLYSQLVFNKYYQLFISILRLIIGEHFRVCSILSNHLFHERIFQCVPYCSNQDHTVQVFSDCHLHFSSVNYTLSSHKFLPSTQTLKRTIFLLSSQRTIIKRCCPMLTSQRSLINLF